MEIEKVLINGLFHFTPCIFLLSGILLWMRRQPGDRSRLFLALPLLLAGIMFSIRIFRSEPSLPAVLSVSLLCRGWTSLSLLYLYPIEVISPGWLTFKKGILLFVPCLLLNLVLLCLPFQFRELTSFYAIIENITEFNVWFRFVILLCIIPYSLMLFYIPYNYKRSSANYKWIALYTIGIQGIGFFYVAYLLTSAAAMAIGHMAYCSLFCLFVTYQELFLRINVPVIPREVPVELPVPPVTPDESIIPEKNKENPLWIQLNELIDREQLWRNPDTNITKLAVLLATNRNKLTQIIQEKGYDGYKEFINRRRINEFLKIADSDKYVNVLDTFFKVGFRSKATALRNFKEYTGMLPSEYLQLRLKKKTKTP
ncbi:helix-turn-helix domain-containing protein [uncultured Sanguibacteroides sp.]|uniref:helix-turn-helix domain-containing protein n=1 Tax=uncultured Sanguibacteroides sp. TaxID=1635151 RepID=UPI002600BDD1|nr:helix-turn-helix domain-containing protein [uncultured Sanguibacteroides sp.]